MNVRKGFFRLTLVLSFLCGILTLYSLPDDIFGTRSRDIEITIPLPNDWENKKLQQKLNSIDELLISLMRKEYLKEKEKSEARAELFKFEMERSHNFMTIGEWKKEFEKENEKRKKTGLKPLERPDPGAIPGYSYSPYSTLTSREQQNVKRRLRDQIISDEKKLPKDRERRNYYVSSGPTWRELSFLVFIGFIIGFTPVWLIYGFTRWVIIAFIVGGFKSKSQKGVNPKYQGQNEERR